MRCCTTNSVSYCIVYYTNVSILEKKTKSARIYLFRRRRYKYNNFFKFEKKLGANFTSHLDPNYSFPQMCPPPRYFEQNVDVARLPSNNSISNTAASLENISPSIEPPTYNSVILESSLQSNNTTSISVAEELTTSTGNKSSRKKVKK